MPGYYINNILSDLLHSGFYSLVSFAHGGSSLGVIYILDRLALAGHNFIFSVTDAVSTQTFATEDENVSAKIMIVNTYLIPLCLLINIDFLKYKGRTESHEQQFFIK